MFRLAVLLLWIISFGSLASAQSECALPPRLVAGEAGRVLDALVNVRAQPGLSGERVGQLPAYELFTVREGPRCADGFVWWRVEHHHIAPQNGWVAEGDSSEYWLEPRGEREQDDEGRFVVTLADGTSEPEGCLAPPDDYTRVQVGSAQFNARTLAMLDHAQRLYTARGGLISFRRAITQGSYAGGVEAASFGTHDGGGAVDLSVRSPEDGRVLPDAEIDLMIAALREAGFAAWLRAEGSLYPRSPIHIHAIAVGDRDLSEAARLQIEGDGGYFAGFDGLPPEWGGPNPDPHGDPVICAWMREAS